MTSSPWWRGAAIYELYVQSFADADGDGIGDLTGVHARLPYLAALGIDAIWFSPWYPSPRSDAGYDVADYRSIDPAFGTLADADALIAAGHAHGIKTIIDIVPNHCSDQHEWFQAALAAPPGSADRARFWFRPGRGPAGQHPPNGWQSVFGGPAWSRTTAPDGAPGEWYLHLFAPEQPDFNWANPEVRAEFEAILRFWFDRGVDGIRIDSAAMLTKDPRLPEFEPGDPSPYADRDDVHDIYRAWRAVADAYPGRVLIGELWLPDATRFARYLRPDELHTVFNFPYLCCPWDAAQLRAVIDGTLAFHAAAGAPATWVLSNHDVDRHVSRYGRADTSFGLDRRDHSQPVDLALGTRRARAAALLTMALPGSFYLYQGEELGLWEVEDLPADKRQDPIWLRTNGADPGRDGSRVPLPWAGPEPPFGFSTPEATKPPWLPQPAQWRELTVETQTGDPDSMLELYRQALSIRRAEPALGRHPDTPMTWRAAPDGVLAFDRGDGVCCVANTSAGTVALPAHSAVLLASGPLADGLLPPDTAVWLRRSRLGPPNPGLGAASSPGIHSPCGLRGETTGNNEGGGFPGMGSADLADPILSICPQTLLDPPITPPPKLSAAPKPLPPSRCPQAAAPKPGPPGRGRPALPGHVRVSRHPPRPPHRITPVPPRSLVPGAKPRDGCAARDGRYLRDMSTRFVSVGGVTPSPCRHLDPAHAPDSGIGFALSPT